MLVLLDSDLLLDAQGDARNDWIAYLRSSLQHQTLGEKLGSTVIVRIVILYHSIGLGIARRDTGVPWDQIIDFLRAVDVDDVDKYVIVRSPLRADEVLDARLCLAGAVNPLGNEDISIGTRDGIVLTVSDNVLLLDAARWYSYTALTGDQLLKLGSFDKVASYAAYVVSTTDRK